MGGNVAENKCRPLRAGGGKRDVAGGQGSRRNSNAAREKAQVGPAHGQVRGDVWAKTVRASVHQLRTPRAWALDTADLGAAERLDARFVDVCDLEGPRDFWTTLDTVRAHGFALSRGFGEQTALILEHWRPT